MIVEKAVNPFQLTRSRGAWPCDRSLNEVALRFQLTRSRGAWRRLNRWFGRHLNFNSHAHVERDPTIEIKSNNPSEFQLTRSRGAWPLLSLMTKSCTRFQLTRSRGAWRLLNFQDMIQKRISTHTLTWSVTYIFHIYTSKCINFNSHAHVERDWSV